MAGEGARRPACRRAGGYVYGNGIAGRRQLHFQVRAYLLQVPGRKVVPVVRKGMPNHARSSELLPSYF